MTQEECADQDQETDAAVWVGRSFGLLIILIALALGVKVAKDAPTDSLWVFLSVIVTPLGVGFLVLIASEILAHLTRQETHDA